MSTLREAAEEALRWMEHARLHLTIKERMHPDGLSLYDSAAEALRAALAEPKTELRDQHKAFTHWYFGLRGINEANFSPEDLAWAAWKAALAQPETAEPVAWQTFDGEGGYDYRDFYQNEDYELEWKRLNPAYADWVTPLYAHPPRDEWRLASEPPDSDRDVQAWIKIDLSELDEVVTEQCEAQAFYEDGVWHVRGPDHDGWMQLCPGHMVSVVVWRDVTPPTQGALL